MFWVSLFVCLFGFSYLFAFVVLLDLVMLVDVWWCFFGVIVWDSWAFILDGVLIICLVFGYLIWVGWILLVDLV